MTTEANAPAGTPAPAAPAADTGIGAPAAPASFAPAAPAAAAPAPAAPAAEAVTYEPTGHAGLDLALSFVGNLGIAPTDPAMQAAEQGNFSLLKAKLATLGDKAKGWEQMIAVGERDFTSMQEANKAKATAQEAKLAEAVGGADQWGAIKEWAGKNAEPEEKAAVNAALAAGGIAAKAMAVYLAGLYSRASGVTQAPAKSAVTDSRPGAPADNGALSPRAYVDEVQKLRAKGGDWENSNAYRELQARRLRWKQ